MANFIINKLTIKGDKKLLQNMLNEISGEPDKDGYPSYIDFNKIIPMPEILKNTNGFADESHYADMSLLTENEKDFKKYLASRRSFTDEEMRELKKIGFFNWYDWRVVNWGTNWNAGCLSLKFSNRNYACINFLTPWTPAIPILQALQEKYPKLKLEMKFKDEFEKSFLSIQPDDGLSYEERKDEWLGFVMPILHKKYQGA